MGGLEKWHPVPGFPTKCPGFHDILPLHGRQPRFPFNRHSGWESGEGDPRDRVKKPVKSAIPTGFPPQMPAVGKIPAFSVGKSLLAKTNGQTGPRLTPLSVLRKSPLHFGLPGIDQHFLIVLKMQAIENQTRVFPVILRTHPATNTSRSKNTRLQT